MSTTLVFFVVAVACELAGLTCLKFAGGVAKPLWLVPSIAAYVASLVIFSVALRQIPVGIAYAAWAALGALGAIAIQVVGFHQPLTAGAGVGIAIAALGIVVIYAYSGVAW
jgi:multidrug transporter EmrE-like cation transporter